MAINIDVPGVGTVTVENAAEESTLRSILDEMRKTNSGTTAAAKKAAAAKKQESDATRSAVDSLLELYDQLDETNSAMNRYHRAVKAGAIVINDIAKNAFRDLKDSAIATSASMIKSSNTLSDNVIATGAELVNTVIDLAESLATSVIGITRAIPILGNGIAELGEGAVQLVGDISRFANEFMAEQYEIQLQSFRTFTAAGASFAGGISEMATLANSSNLSLQGFTEVVKNSRTSIRQMGLSASAGAQQLAQGLGALGTGAGSARTQLFNLGFTFEEQGELMAQFYARERINRQLSEITDEQVRQGTVEYARNLKILADLTGEDAKALMEQARAESMRGVLLAQMDADQRTAFMETYSALSSFGPEVQQALVEQLSFGGIISPAVAANAELATMIQNVAGRVSAGEKDMVVATTEAMAFTAKELRESGQGFVQSVDAALLAGVSGVAPKIAEISNRVLSFLLPEAQAEKSRTLAAEQLETQDAVTRNLGLMTDSIIAFQNQLQALATEMMPQYSDLLETVVTTTTEAMTVFGRTMEFVAQGNMSGLREYLASLTDTKNSKITDLGASTEVGRQLGAGAQSTVTGPARAAANDFPKLGDVGVNEVKTDAVRQQLLTFEKPDFGTAAPVANNNEPTEASPMTYTPEFKSLLTDQKTTMQQMLAELEKSNRNLGKIYQSSQ